MYTKLDSLRGLAACLVVLFHSPFSFFGTPLAFFSNAYLFVDLFFILSGFVMAHSYTERTQNGMSLKTFALLRLGRIYPLHVFMLLVFLAFVLAKAFLHTFGIGGEQFVDKNNLESFISNLLLIHSLGIHDYHSWNYPSWSISVEFYTYLLFFALLKSVDRRAGLVVPATITIASYAFLLGMVQDNLELTVKFGILRCIAAFYLGVLLYRARTRLSAFGPHGKWVEAISVGLVAATVCVAHWGPLYQVGAIAAFFCLLLVHSGPTYGWVGKLLDSPVLRQVGVWSYSIYMIQAIVLEVAELVLKYMLGIDAATITGFASLALNAFLVASIVVASRFTFVFVEKKYRDLIRAKVEGSRTRPSRLPRWATSR